MPKEYKTIQEVAGPLMLVHGVENVFYDELGEIELAVGGLKDVRDCVCLHHAQTDEVICIYEGSIDDSRILFHLRHTLPKYMIPNKFIRVDHMPRNANGKLDRLLLKKLYQQTEE